MNAEENIHLRELASSAVLNEIKAGKTPRILMLLANVLRTLHLLESRVAYAVKSWF